MEIIRYAIAGSSGRMGRILIEAVQQDGLDAIACASIFHYDRCSIPALKAALGEAGVAVRPEARH